MNFKGLAKKLDLKESEYRDLVSLFLKTSKENMALLEASIEQSNAGNTADNAHRIKGAALNLELKEIGALAKDMEGRARNGSVGECVSILPKLKNELKQLVKLTEE
jgi:HPt (histidine-containing phosphotransfer) domain-containing protein